MVLQETKCTTKYVEKQKGMFVGDTKCEKLPRQFCAATGCQFVSGQNLGKFTIVAKVIKDSTIVKYVSRLENC